MEAIGGLFLSLIGGGAASAAPIAAGVAGPWGASLAAGTAAAAGGSSLFTALQLGGSVLGAVASIGAGQAAKREAEANAREQEFQARDEFISGRETSAALKRELAATIGNQAVAFAAGGVDLGSVSVKTAKAQAQKDAESELGIANDQAVVRMMQRRRAAANSRARGANAAAQGYVSAAQQLIGAGADIYERG